jgi:eukaryotic-like serine/threonine-protein kinase
MLERIGNCRIVEEVASGGMAVVYRAIQDHLNRTVAIKALKTAVSSDDALVTRFEREAQSLANLQHENIIHIYDFHRERGALFIVMEYVEGIDLYDLLDTCGRIPYDAAAIIAMQVARALDYVHYRGIVHRDIKPANVMIARQGGVKVMDFGIARDRNFESDLTETGTGIGTPSYMSPEQILGDRLDARSDIFSLGIVLYQMVTGRKPFIEDEQRSVMHKIRLEKHERARKLNPELPRELDRIIDKCLEKEPRHRWRSAQHLVMALERFIAKHVEMNYHSRLVLFLRAQDIITQLEADEYLNPAHGEDAGLLTPQAVQARRLMRRTLLAQGGVLLGFALFAGLIHLAPVGDKVPQAAAAPVERGFVRVVVYPWGRVSIGEQEFITPHTDPIELITGTHTLSVENEFFADRHTEDVVVESGTREKPQEIYVDLEALYQRVDRAGAPGSPGADNEPGPEPGPEPEAEEDFALPPEGEETP